MSFNPHDANEMRTRNMIKHSNNSELHAPTNNLRWFTKNVHQPPRLQQEWHISRFEEGKGHVMRTEWKDIPLILETKDEKKS